LEVMDSGFPMSKTSFVFHKARTLNLPLNSWIVGYSKTGRASSWRRIRFRLLTGLEGSRPVPTSGYLSLF